MSTPKIEDYSRILTRANTELFLEKRMDYDGSNNLIYVGYNKTPNASVDATTWLIFKLTYSGSNVTRYQLPNNGPSFQYSWTLRTSYFT